MIRSMLRGWRSLRTKSDAKRPIRRNPPLIVEVLEDRVNPSPIAYPDYYSVPQNQFLSVPAGYGVLANDLNPDGGQMWAVLNPNGPATQGTLTLQSSGAFTLMPPSGFVGVTSFVYYACNTFGPSAMTATVTINVTGSGSPSVTLANPGSQNNLDGDQVNLHLIATDSAGNPLTFGATNLPAGLTINSTTGVISGSIGPSADSPGLYQVTITAADTTAGVGASQTFGWTVGYKPVLADQQLAVVHDQQLAVDLNDSAANLPSGPLQFTIVTNPAGTLTPTGDGHTFTYTPTPGWTGTDSFKIQASYGPATSNVATYTISVYDTAPVAEDQQFNLHAGQMISLDSTDGLLHDAFDAEGDALIVQLVGPGPANGALNLQPDGSFMYVAKTGYVGDDTFDYRLFDGAQYSGTQQVTIHVEDQAPEVAPTSFDVWTAQGISGGMDNVLANAIDPDGDPMTAVLVSGPQYAALFNLNADGTFNYQPISTPPPGFDGVDSFVIKVSDGTLTSAPMAITLNWTTQPVPEDSSYLMDPAGQLNVSAANGVLANVFNPMGAPVTPQLVGEMDPSVGTPTLNPDGSFSFSAGPAFTGEADFKFGLVGGNGVPVNLPPGTVRIFANALLAASVGLDSVSFAGNATVADDARRFDIMSPRQWSYMSPDAEQSPVTFSRNSLITLQPSFTIEPQTVPFWQALGDNLLVQATSNMFSATGQPIRLQPSHLIVVAFRGDDHLTTNDFVAMDNSLANETDYDTLTLTWQISPDNGRTWLSPSDLLQFTAQSVSNVSNNPIFVTLANPDGWNPTAVPVATLGQMIGWTTPLATVTSASLVTPDKPTIPWSTFYAGVEGNNGLGATSQTTLLTDVWAGFATREVTSYKGMPLTYWESWDQNPNDANSPALDPTGLLRKGDGRCNAWVGFFIDVLRAWGGNASYAANGKQIVVDERRSPVRANGFLVGQWTFGAQNVQGRAIPSLAGYLWSNQFGNPPWINAAGQGQAPTWEYNWEGQPAVTYLGDPSQNNSNPFGAFFNHAVVMIGNTLYDPSYGVTYQSTLPNPTTDDLLNAFQTTALAGYYYSKAPVQGMGAGSVVYMRPVTVANVAGVKLLLNNWQATIP
jgi:hypothetical protein